MRFESGESGDEHSTMGTTFLIEEPGNFAKDGDRDHRASSAVSLQQSGRAKTVHVTEGG